MQQKQDLHLFKGLQQDSDVLKHPAEFLVDAENIRIGLRDKGKQMMITTEKGSEVCILESEEQIIKEINTPVHNADTGVLEDTKIIEYLDTPYPEGNYIGHCIINNFLVLFIKNSNNINAGMPDYIYRLRKTKKGFSYVLLYNGDLGFNEGIKLDTLGSYENELIQKVYWTDNITQPKIINITNAELHGISCNEMAKTYNNDSFNFSVNLQLNEEVKVTKEPHGHGLFPAGVVQYAFTYYNKYAQESNIAWCSPLYYTGFEDRAGSPEETINTSFRIGINNLDYNFEYLRLYSIVRTSLDSIPTVKVIKDIKLNKSVENINIEQSDSDINLTPSYSPNSPLYSLTGFNRTRNKFIIYNLNSGDLGSNVNKINLTGDLETWVTIQNYAYNNIIRINNCPYSEDPATRYILFKKETNPNLIICLNNERGDVKYYTWSNDTVSDDYIFLSIDNINAEKEYYLFAGKFTQTSEGWGNFVDIQNKFIISEYSGYRKNINPSSGPNPDDPDDPNDPNNPTTLKDFELVYYDTNKTGYTVDPTVLLYLGGEEVLAKTINQKDGTLFLGNLKIARPIIPESIKKNLRELSTNPDDGLYSDSRALSYKDDDKNSSYKRINTLSMYEDKDFSNLTNPSTFKNREWYRLGLQFQYKTGKWSEPIFLSDYKIDSTPYWNNPNNSEIKPTLELPVIAMNIPIDEETGLNKLVENGYKKVRGVVVIPEEAERSIIAQGVLCPTVYNIKNRVADFEGYPYVQSSWFTRLFYNEDGQEETLNNLDNADNINYTEYINNIKTIVNKGSKIQFKHNYTLYGDTYRNSEIQGVPRAFSNIQFNNEFPEAILDESKNWSDNSNNNNYAKIESTGNIFAVDQYINTFHSPDIELNPSINSMDLSNLAVRIIGVAKFDSSYGDIDIQTSSAQASIIASGFIKKPILDVNNEARTLASGLFYEDFLVDDPKDADKNNSILPYKYQKQPCKFMVYPWNSSGSLNNDISRSGDMGIQTAVLKTKVISNIKISNKINNLPMSLFSGSNMEYYELPINTIKLFNSENLNVIKLSENKTYYGNVDTLLTPPFRYSKIFASPSTSYFLVDNFKVPNLRGSIPPQLDCPILFKFREDDVLSSISTNPINNNEDFNNIGDYGNGDNGSKTTFLGLRLSKSPIRMKYKSSPHLVIDFKQITNNNEEENITSINRLYNYIIDNNESCFDSSLLMAEIYRPNYIPTFGGKDSMGLENNMWLVSGPSYNLTKNSNIEVFWYYGDTFYQRYDHLKTYPFSKDDPNQIVDIISFMCETRVNCDGRYDKNIGQLSNLNMSPTNFGLRNPVYNQRDNFFNYRILNDDFYKLESYPISLTWSLAKQAAQDVDPWTNITMASLLDVDGNNGDIISLKLFNNELYCFQNKGISRILFNERTAIKPEDGINIEISNNYKVNGNQYLTESIGVTSSDNIVITPSGMYLIDAQSKDLYVLNSQGLVPQPISTSGGMSSWFNTLDSNSRLFYDNNNNSIYIQSNNTVLCYSERLGAFESFFPIYKDFATMFNAGDAFYGLNKSISNYANDDKVYKIASKPLGKSNIQSKIEFISNIDAQVTKWFTNLNVRGNWYNNGELDHYNTFNTIRVYNDYQDTGTINIDNIIAKKKFKVWRFNIPRALKKNSDKNRGRDRISNTWTKIKLTSDKPMEISDLDVTCFE